MGQGSNRPSALRQPVATQNERQSPPRPRNESGARPSPNARPAAPSSNERRTASPQSVRPAQGPASARTARQGASNPPSARQGELGSPSRSSAGAVSSAPVRRPAAGAAPPKRTPPKKRRKANEEDEEGGGSTLITSLLKAVVYIMSILMVSGLLSYFAINVGNDVFAFVKSEEQVQLTVSEGTDVTTLGELLADYGVIQYPSIFDFYVDFRYGSALEFEAGDYTVSPSMSYDELVAAFVKSNKAELVTVVVSIPEGYTVKQIINTLVNKYGLSSEAELTEAIQHGEFDYWFIDELEKNGVSSDRVYRLEGYLYPDTYYYYSNASAETIINKMLKNFDTKMKNTFKKSPAEGENYQEKILNLCKERDKTFDEIVTLASMVHMEAKFDYEYPLVSEVFNNRLNNPSQTNGKLESDATIQYILDERNPDLTKEELEIDNPYNTYLYQGLPPGPISNPTYLSINYALYPAAEGNYYFVATPDGYSLFAPTYKKHQENIAKAKEMREDS